MTVTEMYIEQVNISLRNKGWNDVSLVEIEGINRFLSIEFNVNYIIEQRFAEMAHQKSKILGENK